MIRRHAASLVALALALAVVQPATAGTTMNVDGLLQRACSSELTAYDPGAVVAAVNALQPLGKDKALATVEAFLARADKNADHLGLFLVLRVLFEVPASPGHQPPMYVGGSVPEAPRSPTALPHFPILLVDDVPLMLVSNYVLGGMPEPVSSHIKQYRAVGTLRASLLKPPRSTVGLADKYKASYQKAYGKAPSSTEIAFIGSQITRLRP